MKNIPMHWKVIAGLLVGILYAWLAVTFNWIDFTLNYIVPFGDIFINLLKLIAVPLVLFSIISGVISLHDVKKLGRMGIKTLSAYLITTFLAVSLGLVLVNVIQPGTKAGIAIKTQNRISYELWRNQNGIQKLDSLCLSCLAQNKALTETSEMNMPGASEWVKDKIEKSEKQKKQGPLQPLVDVIPSNIFTALTEMNMIQIIFFAVFFGIALLLIPKNKADPVIKLVEGLNEVMVKMVMMIMRFMPFFVMALMAGQVVKAAGNDLTKFGDMLSFLGWYSITVIIGLLLLIFIVYPILAKVFGKLPFKRFMGGMRDAQITAFSTSSSVATLPVTMNCLQNNLGVSKATTSFVLPIGATVNMDGTSLYQAVAVVALAQFYMVDLSFLQQLTIIGTATLASIGAAAIPSAGLVLMIVVLESVGLNPLWIAIIFPVDRILDMCRTVVNVTGDGTIATIIARTEGEKL